MGKLWPYLAAIRFNHNAAITFFQLVVFLDMLRIPEICFTKNRGTVIFTNTKV